MSDTLRLSRDANQDIVLEIVNRAALFLTDEDLRFILRVGPLLLDPVPPSYEVEEIADERTI